MMTFAGATGVATGRAAYDQTWSYPIRANPHGSRDHTPRRWAEDTTRKDVSAAQAVARTGAFVVAFVLGVALLAVGF